jgi:hypothetical protein
MMQIDMGLLNLLVATVLPFLVALVTRKETDSSKKGILLAVLAGATAMVTQAVNQLGVFDVQTLYLGVQNFIVSIGLYTGLWKPTGAADKVADKTDNVGFRL